MKVKIEYNPERVCCYEVYVKKNFFSFWKYKDSFDELNYAKEHAKSLFKNKINSIIYNDEDDVI